ncbi:MAG TPA: DNA gyrase subunit A [Candidatus Brocadiia bacterium]|nr:DNA gyrase subunit A [Candidatus Brocadiia bacterium]
MSEETPKNQEIIRDLHIEDEMKDSYLTFAMSVIISRALPDVRDGLKPSQRRILVAMNDLNLTPRSKFRKCAKICGDTSGNYHPHGQEVVYPTLYRMAQDFNMRYPLVDGQGNFGSMDGHPPAAMRYTEARLSAVAMSMLEDLKEDTVDFQPNYDETRDEPVVLPGAFPNLLANGTSGIAVGMATSIPPHNLREICDAITRVIDEPTVSVTELAQIVKGPDFPGGGIICGRSGVLSGYRSGRGIITVRAKHHFEEKRGGKDSIVFTEIPYQLSRDKICERIAELVKSGELDDIANINNESDKDGTRIVVELKKGSDKEIVLNNLWEHSQLQSTFSIIMIGIVRGRPDTVNLKDLVNLYILHRREVIRRRTQFRLDRAEARAHILEGLRIALDNLDAVIALIRSSASADEGRARLMAQFALSEIQANAVLGMRLQQLTGLERAKIDEEWGRLQVEIADLRAILADEKRLMAIIRDDIVKIRNEFGDERRTQIDENELESIDNEDLIAEEKMVVTISHGGYVKRMPLDLYRSQGRGGKGVKVAGLKEDDFLEHLFICSTHDYLLLFTNKGRAYWLKVYELPSMSRTSAGRAMVNVIRMSSDETITSIFPVRNFDDVRQLVLATARGVIKKTPLGAYGKRGQGGIVAIDLDEGDSLIGVRLTDGDEELMLCTAKGYAARFHEKGVRSMGRSARGVRGLKLRSGDEVVGLAVVNADMTLLTVCEKGYGKRSEFTEYPAHHRGGQGVIDIQTTKRNGPVIAALGVHKDDEVMLMTRQGKVVRTAAKKISRVGRNTQGVRLISLDEQDILVGVARVVPEDEDESSAEVTLDGPANAEPREVRLPEDNMEDGELDETDAEQNDEDEGSDYDIG